MLCLAPLTGTTSVRRHHQPASPVCGTITNRHREPALLVSRRPSGKETILIDNLPDEFKIQFRLQTSNIQNSKHFTLSRDDFNFISLKQRSTLS
jgi:hypothetical protein